MSEEPWAWSAVQAVGELRSGAISPTELLECVRSRVDAVDSHINALPTLCFDRAERFARELERRLPEDRGILAGLPIPIKDSAAVSGVKTTYGSLVYADNIPSTSDLVVEATEAEGGVIFAKSNTPEFEAGANTFNDVFGCTLNPWNLSRSAGGSSGGAASAVATGMAFIAQGSDFACSLRYPAAFCGVVGLRPSPGLIPYGSPALPHQVLSVMGPIARSVADIGLALDAMARFDDRDPLTRSPGPTSYLDAALAPERPMRAAFSLTLGLAKVDPDIAAVVSHALEQLAAAGTTVEQADPDLARGDDAFRTLRAFQFAALHRETLSRHREKLKPEVVWNIEQGLKLQASDIIRAEADRAAARQALLKFLDENGVLITPTAPVEAFPVEHRYVEEIDGTKLATYLDWLVLGYAISVCGCPAISIPCGLSKAGLPVGLQLVGKPYGERDLLKAAAWCEMVLGAKMTRPIDPKVFT